MIFNRPTDIFKMSYEPTYVSNDCPITKENHRHIIALMEKAILI